MTPLFLIASTEPAAEASGFGALGINLGAFIIQLVTFLFVFLILNKFAFKPIVKLLNERRKVIDDSIRLGQKLEKERDRMQEEHEAVVRDARHEADRIVATSHKEAREVAREAEKTAHKKTEAMIADAEVRIAEESDQARRKLEKDIAQLVAESTEAVVEQKLNGPADTKLIEKVVRERLHK